MQRAERRITTAPFVQPVLFGPFTPLPHVTH